MRFSSRLPQMLALVTLLLAYQHFASASETRHSSGLLLVQDEPLLDTPANPESTEQALELAIQLSEQNPDQLAYPWIDASTGQVVVAATSTGLQRAQQFAASTVTIAVPRPANGTQTDTPAQIDSPAEPIPRSIWNVQVRPFARARLEQIKDEAIDLSTADLPDANLISMTEPDPARNRVIITVGALSDALLNALAARYGTDAIAIRVDPTVAEATFGRQADASPFYGGAAIAMIHRVRMVDERYGFCTDGVPWMIGSSVEGMFTAGHCALNTEVAYPWTFNNHTGVYTQYLGQLPPARSNWRTGSNKDGTVRLPNDSVFRGDAGLVQVTTSSSVRHVDGRIYVSDRYSASSRAIGDMFGRRSHPSDKYCSGGAVSGELCNWKVTAVGIDVKYGVGTGRNLVRGDKRPPCIRGGDSGGPIYIVWSNGAVSMKGIISGGGGGGLGPLIPCRNFYTDIWDAYLGFPGWIRTQ
jgi:hypothetical protein